MCNKIIGTTGNFFQRGTPENLLINVYLSGLSEILLIKMLLIFLSLITFF
jgi:hypothetical protein